MSETKVATASPAETKEVAARVAGLVEAGDLVVLSGELGAGKTAFAQGFGAALGVTEPITSPTFAIAQQYQGRLTVHHLDVYRLEQLAEATDLALSELLDDDAVVLIEWGEAIMPVLPADFLEVSITFGAGDDDRAVEFRAVGERWSARERVLGETFDGWSNGADPC